jgi:PPOX class probable F420-dependent enzyme
MQAMGDDERRSFLSAGTRTGKVAWLSPSGRPHVAPIWFVLDGDDVIFTTHRDSAKGMAFRGNRQISMVVDVDRPPFAYVKVNGLVSLEEDPDELLAWATRIGGRYMGDDRAEEYGRRNGVPGQYVVRLHPDKLQGYTGIAD